MAGKINSELIKMAYEYMGDIPAWRSIEILKMAVEGEWPNGEFSDVECSLWSAYHRCLNGSY